MELKDIKRRTWLYAAYKRLQQLIVTRHPVEATVHYYQKHMKKPLNLDNPRDLNEKIQWLKLFSDTSQWSLLADKLRVRDYIQALGLGHLLNRLYGVWDTPDEIDFDTLPDKFVMKTNNGCHDAVIVNDKSQIDPSAIRNKMKVSLNRHFGVSSVELHYLKIEPKIIAEELLEDSSVGGFSRSLVDYKLWCFNGKPFGFYVTYDRATETTHHLSDFYDLEWHQHTEWMADKSPRHPIPQPKHLDIMIEAGARLSKGYPEMRVDFYDIDGQIYIGELTMSGTSGCIRKLSPETLLMMGQKCDISREMALAAERKAV